MEDNAISRVFDDELEKSQVATMSADLKNLIIVAKGVECYIVLDVSYQDIVSQKHIQDAIAVQNQYFSQKKIHYSEFYSKLILIPLESFLTTVKYSIYSDKVLLLNILNTFNQYYVDIEEYEKCIMIYKFIKLLEESIA